jgi:phosphoserine phosphatase
MKHKNDGIMATCIFDFDSTLITCESTEKILEKNYGEDTLLMEKISAITCEGMEGKKDFFTSLNERLALAKPHYESVCAFAEEAVSLLTPGVEELIASLRRKGCEVWIVSGAIRDVLLPTAQYLGIPLDRVCGVRVLWDEDGIYKSIDGEDPWSFSKAQGADSIYKRWSLPSIAVGDGMTDYALYEKGYVENFIAYTGNARRESVVARAPCEAKDISILCNHIKGIIGYDDI